jgi:hypothetical protein
MRDGLLVGDLVEIGDLNNAIEDKDVAKGLGLKDNNVLSRGNERGDDSIRSVTKGDARKGG